MKECDLVTVKYIIVHMLNILYKKEDDLLQWDGQEEVIGITIIIIYFPII